MSVGRKVRLSDVLNDEKFRSLVKTLKEQGVGLVLLHKGLVRRGWTKHDIDLVIVPFKPVRIPLELMTIKGLPLNIDRVATVPFLEVGGSGG